MPIGADLSAIGGYSHILMKKVKSIITLHPAIGHTLL
jgi:hypothetical protein